MKCSINFFTKQIIALKYIQLFILSIFSVVTLAQQKLTSLDKIVAKVDDQIILESDVQKTYDELSLNPAMFSKADLRCGVLENLIINKLLVAKAEIDSVTVPESEVERNLDDRINKVLQGRDPKLLEQHLGKSMRTIKDEMRDQVREQLIAEEMKRGILFSAKITPSEVKKFFKQIPKDSLPYLSSQVQVAHIVVEPPMNDNERTRLKEMLRGFKNKIEAGEESFIELAKIYSQDNASKMAGGETGFTKRGLFAPEYEAAALSLQPGEISDVVETQFGFHLIQLIERRGNTYNSRHILLRPVFSSQDFVKAGAMLDSLRTLVLNGEQSFQKLASKHSVDPYSSGSGGFILDGNTGSTKIETKDLTPDIYFILDTMKVGNITKPLIYQNEAGEKRMRIVYFKSKTPPHVVNLEMDYQQIQSSALIEKKSRLFNDWLGKAKQDFYLYIDEKYKDCSILK